MKITTAITLAARKMRDTLGARTARIELTRSHLRLFRSDPEVLNYQTAGGPLNWKGIDVVEGNDNRVVGHDRFGAEVSLPISTEAP